MKSKKKKKKYLKASAKFRNLTPKDSVRKVKRVRRKLNRLSKK